MRAVVYGMARRMTGGGRSSLSQRREPIVRGTMELGNSSMGEQNKHWKRD